MNETITQQQKPHPRNFSHSNQSSPKNESLGTIMLTDRAKIITRIKNQDKLDEMIPYFFRMSLLFIMIYGVCLGVYSGNGFQIISSGIKTPMLFFCTMFICAPALYACNILIGPRLSLKQIITLLILKTYFIAFILISAAPILLYFTFTSNSYEFTSLLNITICMVAGSCGVYMLWKEMLEFAKECEGTFMVSLLRIWLFIYMFVGTQMAWSLKPFIGSSDQFVWFRPENGNVYITIVKLIISLFNPSQYS